jgi:hypothetical protein
VSGVWYASTPLITVKKTQTENRVKTHPDRFQ